MMAYFPEHRLLHVSDPFQKISDTEYFTPQTVGEVVAAGQFTFPDSVTEECVLIFLKTVGKIPS